LQHYFPSDTAPAHCNRNDSSLSHALDNLSFGKSLCHRAISSLPGLIASVKSLYAIRAKRSSIKIARNAFFIRDASGLAPA
jgi:hypothetical protein